MNEIKWLRILAFWEGISYLLLIFVAMPLKYIADIHMPNMVIGYIHGFLFIMYCLFLALSFFKYKMSWMDGVLGFLAAWFPFCTFIADKKIFKKYNQ